MKQNSSPLLAGLTLAVSALAGCGQTQPVESTAPGDVPVAQTSVLPPKPAREIGNVAPAAKPGAPVSLEYALRGTPRVGEPVNIDLTFVAGGNSEALEIFCSVDDALSLTDGEFSFQNPANGDSSSHTITVTPQVEGYHYINVIARMGNRARAFAVPVAVGDVDPRDRLGSEAETSTDETGQRIMRFPAEEN